MCRGKGQILGVRMEAIAKNPSGPLSWTESCWLGGEAGTLNTPSGVRVKMDRGRDWQAPDWHPIGKRVSRQITPLPSCSSPSYGIY